jgi:hypothetical protein
VQLLLSKGVSSANPPVSVVEVPGYPAYSESYRKSPFLIQAACQGNLEIFQILLQNGRDIKDVGHICLSRRRRNSVISNVVAAASYHGHTRLLKFILQRPEAREFVNVACMEQIDARPLKGGAF